MDIALKIIWLCVAISPIITYFIWRKGWTEPKFSRAYIRKYFWILRVWLFPLISIYVLLAEGLRAFCLFLLMIVAVNLILRIIFGSDNHYNPKAYIAYCLLIILASLSLISGNPFWVQIQLTVTGGLFAGLSLIAFALNDFIFNPIDSVHLKVNIADKNYRWLSLGLAGFAIILALLNEYFRRSASLEIWALFNAFGVVALLIITFITILPVVSILMPNDDKNNSEIA